MGRTGWVVLVMLAAACGRNRLQPPDALEHVQQLDLGAVPLPATGQGELALRNTGADALIVEAEVTGPDFAVSPEPLTLTPGATALLPVRFTPTALGVRTATLTLRGAWGQASVALRGRGTGPQVSVQPVLSFGTVPVVDARPRATSQASLTFRNLGTAGSVLRLDPARWAGDELCVGTFTTAGVCQPLPAREVFVGEPLEVPVSLRATSPGVGRWVVRWTTDDPLRGEVAVEVVALVEAAAPCRLSALASPVVLVNARGSVTMRHDGPGPCFIEGLSLTATPTGTLRLEGTPPVLPLRLLPGGSFTVAVALERLAPLASVGVLRVTGAGAPPLEVPLEVAQPGSPCLVVAPGQVDFGTQVRTCSTMPATVVLYNLCPLPLVVEDVAVSSAGAPPLPPQCQGPAACPEFFSAWVPGREVVLEPGQHLSLDLHYRPLDLGEDQGVLQVTTRDGRVSIPLAGRGSVPTALQHDTWAVPPVHHQDVLALVDASPSFLPKRAAVRSNLAALLQYWSEDRCLDLRWSLAAAEGAPDASVTLLADDAGVTSFRSQQPGFVARALVAFDSLPVGSETEACFAPAARLLTAPGGAPRPGVGVSVLCISDALEQSPDQGAARQAIATVRGAPPGWAAVVGSASSTCAIEAADEATWGPPWQQVLRVDICGPQWWEAFRPFDARRCGQLHFPLQARPEGLLEVRVDGQLTAPADATGAAVWSYDHTTNAIEFSNDHWVGPGVTVEARYWTGCPG